MAASGFAVTSMPRVRGDMPFETRTSFDKAREHAPQDEVQINSRAPARTIGVFSTSSERNLLWHESGCPLGYLAAFVGVIRRMHNTSYLCIPLRIPRCGRKNVPAMQRWRRTIARETHRAVEVVARDATSPKSLKSMLK
jgi:hypothetical protein